MLITLGGIYKSMVKMYVLKINQNKFLHFSLMFARFSIRLKVLLRNYYVKYIYVRGGGITKFELKGEYYKAILYNFFIAKIF